ncbi:MAG: PAS domain-containing protein [Pseudomonadales bacterium]
MAADDHYLKQELYALIRRDDQVLTFLLDGPVDGLWFWDVDDPEEEWVSAPFWRLLGYDPASKASKASAWHGIIDPDDLAAAMDAFAAHCDDAAIPFDQTLRYRHANGTWIPVRCRGLAIRDAAGKPMRMLGVHARLDDPRAAVVVRHGADAPAEEPARPALVDAAALLRQLEPVMARVLGPRIPLKLRLDDGLPPLRVDPVRLQVALLNLVENARDAMADGGFLIVEAIPHTSRGEQVRPGQTLPAGDYLRLTVSDTGRGMDAEVAAQALRPMFTACADGGHAGMGLTVAHQVALEAGGDIKLRSAPDQGTSVDLLLPSAQSCAQADQPAPRPSQPNAEAPPEPAGPLRILVVEDDPMVLKHVSSLVTSLGYAVRTATNAAEALALIEADRGVDLLLTDIMMPGGRNGSELARAAAELVPDLRVMYMSGYVRDVMAPLGDGRREALMIAKPFRPAELAARIEQALID